MQTHTHIYTHIYTYIQTQIHTNPNTYTCVSPEAHKIKLKADALEAFELEKMRNQHQMRLSNVVEKFKAKQTAELLALRKRVQTVSMHVYTSS
jgi:hypothetical protein